MRDFFVAISAVIPLLVITLVVQAQQGMSSMVGNVIGAADPRAGDPTPAVAALVTRGAGRWQVLVGACAIADVSALALIPFVPEGRPGTWWHWVAFVYFLGLVWTLFLVVRTLLANFLRAEGEAAARARGHGPGRGRW